MKTNAHRLRGFLAAGAQLRLEERRIISPKLLSLCALGSNLFLDLFSMVEVVRQGGVHVSESDGRNVGHNLISSEAVLFVPDGDVEHTNAMTGDAGAPAANARNLANPFVR